MLCVVEAFGSCRQMQLPLQLQVVLRRRLERARLGGSVNAFSLWKPEEVKVTVDVFAAMIPYA